MLSADGLPTRLVVTRSGIRTRHRSTAPRRRGFEADVDAPLPMRATGVARVRDCGATLSPRHFRRGMARPVSCYALLKWWLLLSQHPGCLRSPTSFRTERAWGTLAGGLGCSPLDDEAYPPPSSCLASPRGIRSLVREGSRVGPLPDSVALPPRVSTRR